MTHLKSFALLVAAVAVLCAPSANAAGLTQMNWEAPVLAPEIPTADPCLVDDVRVDVIDFHLPGLQDGLYNLSHARFDKCTGEYVHILGTLELPVPIGEDDFVISPGGRTAELRSITVPMWNAETQSSVPVSVHLQWDLKDPARAPDGEAVVTGEVRGPSFFTSLDSSLNWQPWGSEATPWAALWFCVFAGAPVEAPWCLG